MLGRQVDVKCDDVAAEKYKRQRKKGMESRSLAYLISSVEEIVDLNVALEAFLKCLRRVHGG